MSIAKNEQIFAKHINKHNKKSKIYFILLLNHIYLILLYMEHYNHLFTIKEKNSRRSKRKDISFFSWIYQAIVFTARTHAPRDSLNWTQTRIVRSPYCVPRMVYPEVLVETWIGSILHTSSRVTAPAEIFLSIAFLMRFAVLMSNIFLYLLKIFIVTVWALMKTWSLTKSFITYIIPYLHKICKFLTLKYQPNC